MALPAPVPAGQNAPRRLAATTLLLAVTLGLLWPLVSARRTLPNGDLLAHAWGLAWVDRQLGRDPLRLYDANIYYPEPRSLRLTESLVPQALMVWPLAALGADPVLLVNAATLLSFFLSALFAYLLAFELSRSFGGSLFAGLAYAFCAYRLGHLVHVGVLSTQWFPLILLLTWRQLEAPRAGPALALAGALWAQALSSGYYAYPAGALLVLGALLAGRRAWSRRGLAWLAASALLAAAAVYPFAAPYLELAESAPPRTRAALVHWSVRPASFLTAAPAAARLPHLAPLRPFGAEREALYPGTPVLLLAVLGAVAGPRTRRVGVLGIVGATAAVFSLGPAIALGGRELPGPYELVRLLPLGGLMRVPARLAVLFQLAVCVIGAVGWAALERRGDRASLLLRAACVALWLAESSPRGALSAVREVERAPAFAAWLAAAPAGPVLELPYHGEGRHGLYVYWSTKHWRPLVNGHGTFRAARAVPLALAGRGWPSPKALRALRDAGVRYVVVHQALALSEERERYRRALERPPAGAALRFHSGGDAVFEIAPHWR
jgi:hypothetical protein